MSKYKKAFIREIIDIDITETERFLLKIRFNRNKICNEKATIIMKNPSVANYNYSDPTANKVINCIYNEFKNVETLSILNLFTIIAPNAKELKKFNEFNKASWEKNKKIINEECKNSHYVIFAWGNKIAFEHRERENEVLKIIKKLDKQPYCINTLTKRGFPRHPLYEAEIEFNLYKDELKKWLQQRSLFL
ncbi:DUF1643 domain-containing protein [Clostridioides difficile]|uniref:DUF1643 domain-containing protein n=1 Tax=Clostridioides TaxID=1870884 RepID=UPI000D1E66C0|nr:DUF1643 domain-containing protein [Clostridioides difficile]MCC0664561.1 DUF1643 domain-containing protein [Clostridioides sp. ZZV15-6597]HBE9444583.1 DUF1643 domain-containing protein [Clostridioides difficile]HBF1820719.1 DUF1643 domain-containing protein [Clostridioides difficile]